MQDTIEVMPIRKWKVSFLPKEKCVLLRFRSRQDDEVQITIPEEEAQDFANEIVSARALSEQLREKAL